MPYSESSHRPGAAPGPPGHDERMTSSRFPAGLVRVLLADDDARVRAAVAQTLALEADLVLVAVAADAADALDLAESTDPAVALVDVRLADDTAGLALVTALGRRLGCAVVAMSVRGDLRRAALAAGAVAFAEKADGIDAILAAIRAAAPPHRPASATS